MTRAPRILLMAAVVAAMTADPADAAGDNPKDTVQASLEHHRPGNVFVDDVPARIDLHVAHPGPARRNLTAAWTLTDIDGTPTTGTAPVRTEPGASVVVPLIVGADAFGPYALTVCVMDGKEPLATIKAHLARIRSRSGPVNPDSPFGVCPGVDPRLMALAGATDQPVAACVWHAKSTPESFALAAKHAWNRAKVRDKYALAVAWARSVEGLATLAGQGNAPVTDTAAVQHLPVATLRFEDALLPNEPEGKREAIRTLLAMRDTHLPGKPAWTMDGWWQAKDPLGPEGARMLPRVVLSQLAAGVDRVFWDGGPRDGHPGTPLLGTRGEPTPAYAAYATMTHMLDGARYVGPTGVDPRVQQHWFVRGGDVILAAWYIGDAFDVSFSSALNQIEATDHVGRRRVIEPRHGHFALTLRPDVQYLRFPRESERYGAAGIEMLVRMEALRLFDLDGLPPAVQQVAEKAHTTNTAMARLMRLIRLAEQVGHKGEGPKPLPDDPDPDEAVRLARRAVEDKEGQDGYLRRARVALGWTERLAREVKRQGRRYGPPVAWAVRLAADATRTIAEHEEPYRIEAAQPQP